MINKLKKGLEGFTLIETLVAVLLLTTAIAGPLTIASKSLLAAVVAKDQITAFFLAQDGVEYVRFARDTNKLRNSDWLEGTGINLVACKGAIGCSVDTTTATNPAVCNSSCPLIRYDTALNRFSYTTGTNSAFRRTIQIVENVEDVEALLTVTVSWTVPGVTGPGCPTGTRCIVVKETIFNWQ